MSRSIVEVSRLAGVSSRTLRHYDAIGLLSPAEVDPSGRRFYGPEELLRLQQILLLRDLGLKLEVIREVLDRPDDGGAVAALRRHRTWLTAERRRIGRLLDTVDATIESLEGGEEMAPEKMFEGFEANPYEAEARERFGREVVDASQVRMQAWTADDADLARTGYPRVHQGLEPLLAAGVPVDDPRVQALVQLHFDVTTRFWTPTAESYRGLAQMYVDDERFRVTIGGDALTAYLRDAMHAYASARLT